MIKKIYNKFHRKTFGVSDALFNGRYVYLRIWSIERDVEFEINLPQYAGVSKKSAQMYLRPDLRGANHLKEARFYIDVSDYDVSESLEIQFHIIKSGKIVAQSSIHCDRVDIDMDIYRQSANAPKESDRSRQSSVDIRRRFDHVKGRFDHVKDSAQNIWDVRPYWLIRPIFVILNNFSKSKAGPVWLNVGPFILISLLAFIFSNSKEITFTSYFPYCAIGYLLWTMTGEVFSSSFDFIKKNRGFIENSGMPLGAIALHEVMLNIYTFIIRSPIIMLALILTVKSTSTSGYLLGFLGFILIAITQLLVIIFFAAAFHRFNDFRQLSDAIMRIGFLATPIFWEPERLAGSPLFYILVKFNPFWHFIQIIRAPLLGEVYPVTSLIIVLSLITILTLLVIKFKRSITNIATLTV